MAMNLIHLRSTLKARSCLLLQTKLLSNGNHFSDDSTKKDNLYESLGIPSTATHNEIKKAYYDLTLKYHPDRNENRETAALKFREVAEAYEILGNFSLRKKYDKGVPTSLIKKTVTVPVEHKVKYQEFYDSRSTRSTFTDQSESFDEYSKYSKSTEDPYERAMETDEKTRGVQRIIIAFFCILLICTRSH